MQLNLPQSNHTLLKGQCNSKAPQREHGVTYKTAWRMATVNGEAPLGRTGKAIKVEETLVTRKSMGMNWRKNKTTVTGMMGRDGDVIPKIVKG